MKTKEDVVEEFRKQSICDAALRVVGRKGVHSVTVQDIADEAGVAKGTVYIYFDSRDAVLTHAMESGIAQLMDKLNAACSSCRSFREVLERRIRAQLEHFDSNRDFFRMYLGMSEPSGEKRLRKHPTYTNYLARLESQVRDAIDRGEVRDVRVDRLAIAITSVVREICLHRLVEKDPPPVDEDVTNAVDFLMHGIAQS